MEDREIVALFLRREETALAEAGKKYGKALYAVVQRLLRNREDSREVVGDAQLDAWNSIPPHQPEDLKSYLVCLARRGAVDRLRRSHRTKRGGGQAELSMEELAECLPEGVSAEQAAEDREAAQLLAQVFNRYLAGLSPTARQVFVSRYFYADSIPVIASNFRMSREAVRSMLYRTRKGLRNFLEKEGIPL